MRTLRIALIVLTGINAPAQSIKYLLVERPVVEKRLRDCPKENPQREAKVKELFAEAGCEPDKLTEFPVKHEKVPNVICILKGETDRVIIVGAHTDKVAAGEGIVDNWSGASMLPSLLQSLKASPRHHTFIFIGFTDEEHGMVGSRAYVSEMTKEEKLRTDAMVNMDTMGLAPTEVWATHSDPLLVNVLAAIAKLMKLPVSAVNVDKVGSTDSESFRKEQIPSITIHSLTQQTLHILHSPGDTVSALHFDEYYDSYHLIAGYLAYLDQALPPPDKKPQTPAASR